VTAPNITAEAPYGHRSGETMGSRLNSRHVGEIGAFKRHGGTCLNSPQVTYQGRHRAQGEEHRAQGSGHRVKSTGLRAQGEERRAQSAGHRAMSCPEIGLHKKV
jgi:hypothetical protein